MYGNRTDADFDREFNIAQQQYDNQTPEDYQSDDYDAVEMTEEEWADMDQNEPDW